VFDWLFDNRLIIGVLLCAVLAAFGVAWWRTRKKRYAISVGVVLLLLAVYGLLAWLLIETSSQQMERRVSDMAESVQRKDIRATLEKHLADDFHFGQYDKKGFIDKAQQLRDGFGVDKVTVWNFTLVEIDRDKGTAKFHFNAKPITSQETPFYLVKAVFVMKPKEKWSDKEEWRMQSFEYFNPLVDANSPLPIW
jgi:hypothetical protein